MSNNNLTVKPTITSLISHSAPEKTPASKDASGNESFQTTLKSYSSREAKDNHSLKQTGKNKTPSQAHATDEKSVDAEHAQTSTEPEVQNADSKLKLAVAENVQTTVDPKVLITETTEATDSLQVQTPATTEDVLPLNLATDPAPLSLVNILAAQSFNEKLQQQSVPGSADATTIPGATVPTASTETTLKPQNTLIQSPTLLQAQTSSAQAQDSEPLLADGFKRALAETITEQFGGDKNTIVPKDHAADTANLNLSALVNSEPAIKNASSLQPSVTHTLNSHFYSDNWGNDLNQQVVSLRHNNIDNATLRLNPEHLGPIEINIKLDPQSQTYIQFWSENPEVRQAIRDSLPSLNTLFNQSGLQLGNADVSSQQNSGSGQPGSQSTPNRSASEDSLDGLNSDSSNSSLAEVNNLVNVYI